VEVTVNIELNRQELWILIESLPTDPQGSKKLLSDKLRAARVPFERTLSVYGGASKIKPAAALNDYHNKESV
jgi:hypothetical protein